MLGAAHLAVNDHRSIRKRRNRTLRREAAWTVGFALLVVGKTLGAHSGHSATTRPSSRLNYGRSVAKNVDRRVEWTLIGALTP